MDCEKRVGREELEEPISKGAPPKVLPRMSLNFFEFLQIWVASFQWMVE